MTDKNYKTPFNVRLERQWESAESRQSKKLWGFDLFRKMVEEESKYDADVIDFLKEEIKKSNENYIVECKRNKSSNTKMIFRFYIFRIT